MKKSQDLCHVEYNLYRRQVLLIRHLAQTTNQRPSEVLRSLLDHALAGNMPNSVGGGE